MAKVIKFINNRQFSQLYLLTSLGELAFGLSAFSLHLKKYHDNLQDVAKFLVYLTNWKLFFFMIKSSVEITYIIFYMYPHREFKSFRTNDPFYVYRKIGIDLSLTINILWVVLVRRGTWEFHSLDTFYFAICYTLIPLKISRLPPFECRDALDDYVPTFKILSCYGIFYGIYQGILNSTTAEETNPYGILNWRSNDAKQIALTAIFSLILPIFMPMLCQALTLLFKKAQPLIPSFVIQPDENDSAIQLLPSSLTRRNLEEQLLDTQPRNSFCGKIGSIITSCFLWYPGRTPPSVHPSINNNTQLNM